MRPTLHLRGDRGPLLRRQRVRDRRRVHRPL